MAKLISNYKAKTLITIFCIGLAAGTLDVIAAMLWNYKAKPGLVFKFIASGVYGKAAFAGGNEMVITGVIFHYLIALAFTAAFYFLYPFLKKNFGNFWVIGLLYGVICWFIMNVIVVPVSQIGIHKFQVIPVITGLLILIICIGLPVAFLTDRYGHEKIK